MTVGFPAYAMAALLWLALIAFAVLGGADFGAGIWDLVSRKSTGDEGTRLRAAIVRAIGPIWEANGIWIVYFITGLWTVFPLAFATLTTVLFIPLVIGLLGIVMRGASFAYYTHFRGAVEGGESKWEAVFGAASAISPFVLGAGLAAVASGEIRMHDGQPQASYWSPWTTPFALVCGAFAVALCLVISAVYLTVEERTLNDETLVETFRRRALFSGAATSVIGLIALVLAHFYAPGLFSGLLGKALPILVAAMVAGAFTALMLQQRHYSIARISVAAMVTLILTAWAFAQMPALIPPDVTITDAAAPYPTQLGALILSAFGVPVILVSFWLLLYVFKAPRRGPKVTAAQFADSLQGPPEADAATDAATGAAAHGKQKNLKERDQDVVHAASRTGTGAVKNAQIGRRSVLTIVEGVLALVLPVAVAILRRNWHQRALRDKRQVARRSYSIDVRDETPIGVA